MRSVAHKSLLAAAAVGLLLASVSCAKLEGAARERAVDDAAARFHENFKASRLDEIYDEASDGRRRKVKKKEFVERLRGVRASLADIARAEEATLHGREKNEELGYVSTSFDVDGSAEDCHELMLWDVSGGEARLLGFSVLFGGDKG